VRGRDGEAVEGATVRAAGPASASGSVDATSGFYLVNVKAGKYEVTPSGGPKGIASPRFDPTATRRSVAAGGDARADFRLNGGLKVGLAFSQKSAAADGSTVVKAEITTKRFGKAAGGVTLSLRPKPEDSGAVAVTTGARATICATGPRRVWPTGTIATALGTPVDVVTDAKGVYDFTMTVGTTPGQFTLNAWAKNAAGELITKDLGNTSPDETLTLTPTGNLTPSKFLSELAVLKSDAAVSHTLASMNDDAASMAAAFSQLSGAGGKLGGLAYSLVSGKAGGTALLANSAADPPTVARTAT